MQHFKLLGFQSLSIQALDNPGHLGVDLSWRKEPVQWP